MLVSTGTWLILPPAIRLVPRRPVLCCPGASWEMFARTSQRETPGLVLRPYAVEPHKGLVVHEGSTEEASLS